MKLRAVSMAAALFFGSIAAILPATATQATPPVAVFLGDSYTDTNGVPGGWSSLVTQQMGWTEVNMAYGGTGYITPYIGPLGFDCPYIGNSNFRCPPYNELIGAIDALNPDIVIVSGGRNELGQETTTAWQQGVLALYRDLRLALPTAAIYGISPIWDDSPVPPGIITMRSTVHLGAYQIGGCYVAIGDPLLGHPELVQADSIHPNAAGHQVLADLFVTLAPLTTSCTTPLPRTRPPGGPYFPGNLPRPRS